MSTLPCPSILLVPVLFKALDSFLSFRFRGTLVTRQLGLPALMFLANFDGS